MDTLALTPFLDIVFRIDAGLAGPILTVDELLALRAGTVILTGRQAGESVTVTAGEAVIGTGELGCCGKKATVRMLTFGAGN